MAKDPAIRHDLNDLLAVMARLRDPDTGCPWDVKQTSKTIAPYTIEEAYEVADAVERNDTDGLKDELGDLLLQVVYHAQIASEADCFEFADVVDAITQKMIRRHPHVFGDPSLRDEFLSGDLWEKIKAEEKVERGETSGGTLDGIAAGLPGLTRAVKLQTRAARVGFDWPHLGPVLDKAEEEIAELKEAIAEHSEGSDKDHVAEEFGDLLFVMANLARHLGIDPETAVRAANAKFERRFGSIEAALAEDGRIPEESTLNEMDELWDAAKEAERKD